jgi:hypothetical protein
MRSLFIRENLILSLENMLRNDYDREDSVTKQKSLVVSLKGPGAGRQEELIGGKSPVVK